jgi:DNA end-binding protein Ku
MAQQLIDSFTGDFDPSRYRDTYRAALRKVIDRKAKGKTVEPAKVEEREPTTDLMDALMASLGDARGARSGKARTSNGSNGSNGSNASNGGRGLAKLSKSELDERARKAGIKGRSRMSKPELVKALRK